MNGKRTVWTGRAAGLAAVGTVSALVSLGCGTSITASFPNQLIGAEGQRFTVEQLEAISGDPDLDDDRKREAFRSLGLEDERLIDALLGL